MPRPLSTPDHLFDRTWRPGHPFRPRLSARRRLGMTLLFFVLCAIIGGYWYATDSRRVRSIAEDYLSDLVGGRVVVGQASVSIFEGLRLDDVVVYADETESPDSVLFTAQTFLLKYSPRTLLSGRLEATQIIAIDPHVRLTENLDSGQWNYQRLARRTTTQPSTPSLQPVMLPEVLLRNAQVDYAQMRGGEFVSLGSMGIEGQLLPIPGMDRYSFKLQSRGAYEAVGPQVSGEFDLVHGHVVASLQRFEFGRDIKAMLPAQVRQWWEDHQLSGRVDVPLLSYRPGNDGHNEFTVEIVLRGVTLSVHPEEWTSNEEMFRRAVVGDSFAMMRVAGLNHEGFVDHLAGLIRPSPIQLQQVNGTFIFTQQGIEIRQVEGLVEGNALHIAGQIGGYTTAAPVSLMVRSLENDPIFIRRAPRYINSMPPQVREIYDHLRPQGTCSFWVRIDRPSPDQRPDVSGEVEILDGNFVFDKFPYPIRAATGTIRFGRDSDSGHDKLELINLRGRGIAGGPNEQAVVHLGGVITPLGSGAGVNIRIESRGITAEPALLAAFPRETQQALRVFDAAGTGEFPKFSGDFVCDVIRPMGRKTKWKILIDVVLRDAEGALVAFPYPLKGVSGLLKVRNDHVEIVSAKMKRGDSTLEINGRVDWGREDAGEAAASQPSAEPQRGGQVRPDLTITARNVPVDKELLAAMPAEHRAWIERIGASGRFNLDGKVVYDAAAAAESDAPGAGIGFDMRVHVLDGSLWPAGGTFAASNVTGTLRLQPRQLLLNDVRARRGEAELSARGVIAWPEKQPRVVLAAEARNLALDSALYQLLPEPARRGWDQVQPQGTIDAQLTYSGDGTISASAPDASSTAGAANAFELVLTPRKFSATPLAFPYPLDEISGKVVVRADQVRLHELVARHGEGIIRLSGTGSTDAGGAWDLQLNGENITPDEQFIAALPTALRTLFQSSQLSGKLGFNFERLVLTPRPAAATAPVDEPSGASTMPTTAPVVDADFIVRLDAQDAGLTIGVPMENVNGSVQLQGVTRGGRLAELSGRISVPSLTLASRPVRNLRADLYKRPDQDIMQLSKLQAQIAGGELAGQVDWTTPQQGAARYALGLVLHNADVQRLTGEAEREIRGQLSASLSLEGAWDDPTSRRGRGDVTVNGEEMYRIPVILGLLQITNLALPITTPFREGTCRYSVDGNRVTVENIELRSREMLMNGNGHLDFGTKQVRMTFVTNNINWPKLPILGDLLEGARKELLQIHVRGKLEEPKITAGSMRTFTTTIDEVFRGDAPKE